MRDDLYSESVGITEAARTAHRSRDWATAAKLWAEVRSFEPNQSDGYTEGCEALRELGLLYDAETLAREAIERFPENARAATLYASIPMRFHRWEEALTRWEVVMQKFPNDPSGNIEAAVVLREMGRLYEAEAMLASATERFPNNPWPMIHHASVAMRRQDWTEGLRRWEVVRKKFPNEPSGYFEAGLALREMGRLDEAEAMLASVMEQFPNNPWPMVHHASIAMRRHDWTEGLRRCDEVREKFPNEPSGYLEAGLALREMGNLDEAEAMLASAMTQFPNNPWPMIHHASIAMRRHNWTEGLRRCDEVRKKFPNEPSGYLEAGVALREKGSLDEAEAMLASAMELFPNNPWSMIHHASIAMQRQHWNEALRRWGKVRKGFPIEATGYVEAGRALCELRRFDEAEVMLAEAMQRFPANATAAIQHALAANARKDWPEALRRWRTVRQKFPSAQAGYTGAAAALRNISDSGRTSLRMDAGRIAPIPTSVGKLDAAIVLAHEAGLETASSWEQHAADILSRITRHHAPIRNPNISFTTSDSAHGLDVLRVHEGTSRPMMPPLHTNGRPDCFPAIDRWTAHSPAHKVLSVPDGYFAHIAGAPVVFLSNGRTILRDWSSRYSELVYFYDFNATECIDNSLSIDGTVVAITDNVRPLNFAHWLLDWLPRLEFLERLAKDGDVYVITIPITTPFQQETLAMCGVERDRIIPLGDNQAVRARRLLVPADLDGAPHPCFKGAPWAVGYLRSKIGAQAVSHSRLSSERQGQSQRLYISRSDAARRKVINDNSLAEALASFGYRSLTLSALPLVDQVAEFMRASHVVSLHGAGLANLVFSGSGGQVVEIFPKTFGMPSLYHLAVTVGKSYASYIADRTIESPEHKQFDDVEIDVNKFISSCRSLL